MGWKAVAAKLADAGVPFLAKLIDGEILNRIPVVGTFVDAEHVERILRKAIAFALGVEPTPEAVAAAIDEQPTGEVLARLKAVEAQASDRWPAIADVLKAEIGADVEIAKLNSEVYLDRARAEAGSNDPNASRYKVIALYGLTFALLYLVGLVLYALTVGGDRLKDTIAAWELILGLLGTFGSLILGHWVTRASERKALLAPPPPAVTVTPAATVTAKKR